MKVSKYTIVGEQNGTKYLYHQISGTLLKADAELANAIENSLVTTIPEELQVMLTRSAFLVEDDLIEHECMQRANERYRNSSILRITIMPTLDCNFNCWYCYEKHYPSKMGSSERESVIKFIKREIEKKALTCLHLDWFGGEPLLYFRDIVYPISMTLKLWCEKNGIAFYNSITTNGSLITNQMVTMMNEIKMKNFQITLDGDKEAHNKVRFSVKMLDSYSRIVNNIHHLVRSIDGVSVDLRLNYTTENIDTLNNILASFDYDVRKSINVSPHIVWQYSDNLDVLSDKIRCLENSSLEQGYCILNQKCKARCISCYVENYNQYVINHNLDVYKCTAREFDRAHCVGHIETNGYFIPNSLFQKYIDTPSPFNNQLCLDCEYLPTCLNVTSCIQKSIEGQQTPCMKEEVKKDIHNFIRRTVLGKAQQLLLTLLFFLCSSSLFAQPSSITFSGNVKDNNGTPVVGAIVTLQSLTDSTYTKVVATNDQGIFRFDSIQKQEYQFTLSCLGYETYQDQLSLDNIALAKTYTLEEKTEEIEAVKIAAYFSRHKITGETEVLVKDNPLAEGKSSLDFLRFVHGVTVAGGEIRVAGKDKTMLVLDNRKITTHELSAIPTSMIQSLTVIPNPGAEYGIEDKGIIIVKLRDTVGLLGVVNPIIQADAKGFVDARLSNTLQYQHGKLRLYNNLLGGYGTYRSHYRIKMHNNVYQYESNEHKEIVDYGIYENFALHYQLHPRHDISVYAGGMVNNNALNQKNKHETLLTSEQQHDKEGYNVTSGLFYQYKINGLEDGVLSLKTEYVHQNEKTKNNYIFASSDRNSSSQNFNYLTVEPKVDIKISKKSKGIKGGFTYDQLYDANTFDALSHLTLRGLQQQDLLNTGVDLIPWFEYYEMVGSRLFVQLGLSYHYTHADFKDRLYNIANYSVDHKGWHPNIKMQYLLHAPTRTIIEASYRRDFSLPNYGYYNPIAQYQTENFYSIGNRHLKQEILHNGTIKLYMGSSLSLGYDLLYRTDVIQKVTEIDPMLPNTYYTIPKNLGTLLRHRIRLESDAAYGPWYASIVLYELFLSDKIPQRKTFDTSFGWYFSNHLEITKNITFTLLFQGYTGYKRLTYESGAFYMLDAGLNFSLFDKRLSIDLSGSNILRDEQYRRMLHTDINIDRWDKYPSWRLKLNLRWTFSAWGKIDRSSMPQVTVPERKSTVPFAN